MKKKKQIKVLKAQSCSKRDLEREISSAFTTSDEEFNVALNRVIDELREMSDAIFVVSRSRRHTSCYRDWSSDVCSSDLDRHRQAHRPDPDEADAKFLGFTAPPTIHRHLDRARERQLTICQSLEFRDRGGVTRGPSCSPQRAERWPAVPVSAHPGWYSCRGLCIAVPGQGVIYTSDLGPVSIRIEPKPSATSQGGLSARSPKAPRSGLRAPAAACRVFRRSKEGDDLKSEEHRGCAASPGRDPQHDGQQRPRHSGRLAGREHH